MLEKIGQLAEKAASNVNVSRRGFFSRLGKAALAVAGGLGFSVATADGAAKSVWCCFYTSRSRYGYAYAQFCSAKPCPNSYDSYTYGYMSLGQKTKVANCTYCANVHGYKLI